MVSLESTAFSQLHPSLSLAATPRQPQLLAEPLHELEVHLLGDRVGRGLVRSGVLLKLLYHLDLQVPLFNTETGVDITVRDPHAAVERRDAALVSRIVVCWPWGRGRRDSVEGGCSETSSLR